MIATALLGAVLAARGPALVDAFQTTAWAAAGMATAAAAAAFLLVPAGKEKADD